MNAQIVLEKIGVHFPNRILFEDVNWTLYEGMRVALAGRNGSGKSTLLRILSGKGESNEGKHNIVGSRKLRIGYLDQTLLDSAVLETLELKDKSASAVSFIKDKLVSHEEEIYEEQVEWETRKILMGLGFSTSLMDGPISHLSGGWLLRMFIAAALLEKPEVLLLDEPTNHLDISSIQWLEEFLVNEYAGSLVLITHDVELQKRVTDSLAILHGGRFYFRTHQRDYLTFKDSLGEEKMQVQKNIESLQKKIEVNLEFAARFKAKANTAARAQSKLKAAEEMQKEQAALKDRLQRIEGFAYNMHFRFRLSQAGSKFPISTKELFFRYDEHEPWIIKNLTVDIKRGQKVAIMGDNGAGKTTLLNIIAERLKPTQGELQKGYAVDQGYFGQHQLDELLLDESILENLRVTAQGVGTEQLRGWLGAFGFGGNDAVDKKAKVLSGGERARLALLRILTAPHNVCLLDEPTNHLDVETKELLKDAVKNFEGTMIFVSHDRDFIRDVADRIIYLTSDHQCTDHIGNLESFFEKYPEFVRHIEGKAKPSTLGEDKPAPKVVSESASLTYEERKKIKNQVRSFQKKIEALEADIDRIGREKAPLHEKAHQESFYQLPKDEQNNVLSKLGNLETALAAKMVEWERYSAEIEIFRTKYPDIK